MKKQFLYSFILSTVFISQASASDDEEASFTGSSSGASVRGADCSSSSSSPSRKRSRDKGKEVAEDSDSEADPGDDCSSSSAGLCRDDEGSSSSSADSKRQRVPELQVLRQLTPLDPKLLVSRFGGSRPVLSLRPNYQRGRKGVSSLSYIILRQLFRLPIVMEKTEDALHVANLQTVTYFDEPSSRGYISKYKYDPLSIKMLMGIFPDRFALRFHQVKDYVPKLSSVLMGDCSNEILLGYVDGVLESTRVVLGVSDGEFVDLESSEDYKKYTTPYKNNKNLGCAVNVFEAA